MSQPPPETSVTVDSVLDPSLPFDADPERVKALIRSIVERELPPGAYLIGLHIVDDDAIRALNAEHRGKDTHTDVLSFPLHEPDGHFVLPAGVPVHLGDVVVSFPRARAQAAEFGHSLDRELGYLVAHGTLHLLGYDHEDAADRARMRQKEEAALEPLGLTR